MPCWISTTPAWITYDLAVTLNDWCVAADGKPITEREQALLEATGPMARSTAPPATGLAVAALRFWLSRLAGPVSEHSEGQGSKDPKSSRDFGWRMQGLRVPDAARPVTWRAYCTDTTPHRVGVQLA